MTKVEKEIGQRIRRLRRRKGLTQEVMADLCGIHWTYIGGLERGERNPTLTTLIKIAEGLSVDVRDLFLLTDKKKASNNREEKEGQLLKVLKKRDDKVLDLVTTLAQDIIHWQTQKSR